MFCSLNFPVSPLKAWAPAKHKHRPFLHSPLTAQTHHCPCSHCPTYPQLKRFLRQCNWKRETKNRACVVGMARWRMLCHLLKILWQQQLLGFISQTNLGGFSQGKQKDISEKCSRHCQKAQWSHSFEINPDERLLIFCQITSYPKLQEEHFKKENTDFNDGNGYFEQLRTGNIRTSRNQTSQQETPNNLGYKNCWAHNAEVIAAVPWAFQCSHIHTTLLSRTLLVFCSFQDFAYFSPLFIITHLNLYHIQGLPGRWRCWALGTSLGYLSCPIQWTLPLQSEQPRWRKRSSDKKTNQNNTSIISTTEKPDDLCRHIWADFSHARVEQ